MDNKKYNRFKDLMTMFMAIFLVIMFYIYSNLDFLILLIAFNTYMIAINTDVK